MKQSWGYFFVGVVLSFWAAGALAAQSKFLIIYDSSNSMWGELSDQSRKYESGRNALSNLLNNDFGGRDIGFRAYGHREKSDCNDSELVVDFAEPDKVKADILKAAESIRPTGKTPITLSLRESVKDFSGDSGDILLISDGIETCDIDPCQLVNQWRKDNIDIRVHVVGVGLTELERSAMSCIAETTQGKYFDADSAEGFSEALKEARFAIDIPKGEPDPQPQEQGYALNISAIDDQGRRYIAKGKLFKDDVEVGSVTSNGRNVLDGPGNYRIEIGPVLKDGSIFKPVTENVSIEQSGDTHIEVIVNRPAIVSANFTEEGEEHPGSLVYAYQDDKEMFRFRAFDEALALPGDYEFRATPNKDNKLSLSSTLTEGEHTELSFELLKTVKFYVHYQFSNGDTTQRGGELWRDGEKLYNILGSNGGRAQPGVYELRSSHKYTPLTPVEIEVVEEGQIIEVPLDNGYVIVRYAESDDYTAKPGKAFIESKASGKSNYAGLDKPIAISPGAYTVNPNTNAGFFDPIDMDIVAGETTEVMFEPKPLGNLTVEYAPSENYEKTPDRAFVYALDGQTIIKGFMRPGKPLKFLPGRYKVEPWSYAGDIASQEIEIKAHQDHTVVLKLRSEE